MNNRILAGVALAALCPAGAALAQSPTEGTQFAAQSDVITVFGVGQTRQQMSVTGADLANEAPGTSPLKAIERLPGVSFQSADAFGSYEWSARIVLRGFNQQQLGFTLDGVPLGDMSYGNHNGLHVSRAVISENIDRVDVAQGSGALGTASSSNLGGTIEFISRRPDDVMGGEVAGTYGSEDTTRLYGRFDTGALLGDLGPRFSISGAAQEADKWKGVGEQVHDQINASFVQPIARGEISGFYNWSERRENDYQDLTLDMIERLGYDWDNISGDWPLAILISEVGANRGDTGICDPTDQDPPCPNPAAGTTYPAPIETVDDAYFNASGLRDDRLGSVRFSYPITDWLEASVMAYDHQNEGQGLWWTPYVPTFANSPTQTGLPIPASDAAPVTIRTTEYDIDRQGLTASTTVTVGMHEIEGGLWLEENAFNQARRFYGLTRSGVGGRDSHEFQENPMLTQWEYDFDTYTQMFYLQDTWSVTELLTIFGGFKSINVKNNADTIVGADKTGGIKASESFLPQVGFTYDLSADHQIFGSYAENMRAFESSATGGPFSATAAGFAAIRDTLEPETSKTFELGWRFRFADIQGSVAAYNVEFEDRLLGVSLGAPILGLGSGIQNVGSVKSRGVETAAVWRLTDAWSLFGSYSYNDSTYEDDVVDGAGNVTATGGKTVVNTPEHLLRGEVGYDDGSFFGTLAAAYTGERFSSYLNDEKADSYTLVELTGGYRFDGSMSPWLEGVELQVNVTNLLDEEYISTVGSGGFQNTAGRQTFLSGAPQQAFVTLRKRF